MFLNYLHWIFLSAFCLILCSCEQQNEGVDPAKRSITYSISQEPPTLSSIGPVSSVAFTVQTHIFEGLMRLNENKELVGGVAERWDIQKDRATFYLRKDAKWNDGSPVTAHDFVYGWQVAASPLNEYNFIMAPIKNSSAVAKGELEPNELAVRAIDDYTLECEFAYPCAYFPPIGRVDPHRTRLRQFGPIRP